MQSLCGCLYINSIPICNWLNCVYLSIIFDMTLAEKHWHFVCISSCLLMASACKFSRARGAHMSTCDYKSPCSRFKSATAKVFIVKACYFFFLFHCCTAYF